MRSFLDRLGRAMLQGAALGALTVGCGGDTEPGTPDEGGTGGTASGSGGQTSGQTPGTGGQSSGQTGGSGNGGELEPYPVASIGCSGEDRGDEGPYYGQCCVEAACYTPDDGECLGPDQLTRTLLPELPAGSGSCSCGEGVSGPYASRDDHEPSSSGTCCYLVPSIGCEGRPFLVEAVALVAPVVRRSDWGSSRA